VTALGFIGFSILIARARDMTCSASATTSGELGVK